MITIYKTPSCAFCAQTVRYLDSKKVLYHVVDVSSGEHPYYEKYAKQYGYSVPLVTDGQDGFVGWNLRKLNEMIARGSA